MARSKAARSSAARCAARSASARSAAARSEAARSAAARSAAARPPPEENILSVVTGPSGLRPIAAGTIEAARVYEAVATPPTDDCEASTVRVRVGRGSQPLVLLLSSNHAVDWQLEIAPDAAVEAVLLAGSGASTITGAGQALVASIGGFCAFRQGTQEFRHLEDEVLRCTRRRIGSFETHYSVSRFEVPAS